MASAKTINDTKKSETIDETQLEMENFMEAVYIESITSALMSGRPLSKMWGFPSFMLNDEKFLETLFGKKGWEIYKQLDKKDQNEARKWFETHGVKATEMYGGELHEEWDDSKPGKKDLIKFKHQYPKIYKKVAKNIAETAYKYKSENFRTIIASKFIEDPTTLETTLEQNVKL